MSHFFFLDEGSPISQSHYPLAQQIVSASASHPGGAIPYLGLGPQAHRLIPLSLPRRRA